jgi:caffeoyl-CoA O-methyltransferase
MDHVIDPRVAAYLRSLDRIADPVLEEMEELARKKGFPIVGAHAGRLLGILTRATGARRVLELGSGFGYSAWWFARSLPPGGRVEEVRTLAGGFDVVFNDIDKQSYPESVPVAVSLLRPGGLFITDNVLWSGKVAESWATDPSTLAIRRFNELLQESGELEAVILPVHDGLAVAVKR